MPGKGTLAALLIGGYLLGRTKKLRLALTVASLVGGGSSALGGRKGILSRVTGLVESSPQLKGLVEQVTGMVRWRESVAAMADAGVSHFVEFGGKVLGPMVKRIAPDARVTSVISMDDIDALVKEI